MKWQSLILALVAAMPHLPNAVAGGNPIQIENAKPGTPGWQIANQATNHEIEGYASLTSVARGGHISFYINTGDPTFTIDIYRMGWYGGAGAREVEGPLQFTGIAQTIPVPQPVTGLVECNWIACYTLNVPQDSFDPTDWCSGVYIARLTGGSGKQNLIYFVVRDDDRASDFLFQSSTNTFQAYNNWGGRSFYPYNSNGEPAHLISYNRPYGANTGHLTYLTGWEYGMTRFLEREGYDVTYCTDIDTHENVNLLLTHKGFLVVGHDEYWSWQMRDNVEAARDHGVNLGFFCGNGSYWQVRFQPSAVSGAADRIMVGYKTYSFADDPVLHDADSTNDYLTGVHFADPPVSRPEDAMMGVRTSFGTEIGHSDSVNDIIIQDPTSWVCAGTGLNQGDRLIGLAGYEVDAMGPASPPNTHLIAHSPVHTVGNITLYSDIATYTQPGGGTVVAFGAIQWAWGLDGGLSTSHPSYVNPAAQQMTRNVLSRFRGTIDQPAATGFAPTGGPAATSVVLNGSNFAGTSAVFFNGQAAKFSVLSDSQIDTVVPANATSGPIAVVRHFGTFVTSTPFIVTSTAIASFSPGGAAPGAHIAIAGAAFTGATSVTFNGIPASFTVDSATLITATVPANATTGPLTVASPSGVSTSASPFYLPPRIASFSPASAADGTRVVIQGRGFTGVSAVLIGNVGAAFTIVSDTQITATVPANATSGPIAVTGPGGSVSSATALAISSPAIVQFAPSSSPPGTQVIITGSLFTNATAVQFNGVDAVFTVNSATQITTLVPAACSNGPLTVLTPQGVATGSQQFVVASTLTGFNPSQGPAGSQVVITGNNFQNMQAIVFAPNPVYAIFTVNSPTRITAIVPPGACSGPIGIVAEQTGRYSATSFVVTSPSIGGFAPGGAPAGTPITISGHGFTGTTEVHFAGTPTSFTVNSDQGGARYVQALAGIPARFTVNSDTSLTAIVPANAGIGRFTVTTANGTAIAPADFTPPPTIASFSPAAAAPGTDITIYGSNFLNGGTMTVKFGGVSSIMTTVLLPTKLIARTPNAFATAPITVTSVGGTGGSATPLVAIP